jgi:23S rRNA-/tRNA-specific pseudouridylate synthase
MAKLAAPLSVVWSREGVYVLNKAAGLATQELPGMLNALLCRPAAEPVWLPHRIDKYTQGLQVATTDKAACTALSRDIMAQQWQKRYRVVACTAGLSAAAAGGSPLLRADGSLRREGLIESFLARRSMRPAGGGLLHPHLPNCMLFSSSIFAAAADALPPPPAGARWKHARTRFELAGRSACEGFALYDVELLTGRTHQIRLHFAAAGLPLAHDFYYNPAAFHYAAGYGYAPGEASHKL